MTTREETAATVAVGTGVAAVVAGLVTVAAWGSPYGVLWLAVYSVALNEAERRVDAGTAAMLVNTGPILIAIFAGMFLHEGFPPRLFAGYAVAFCVRS
jgi:drug/metabolite transporter (DMT)-like permease